MHNIKNLKIWHKAMDLTDLVLYYIERLPVNQRFNLIDQIKPCSCSVPANIAEGSAKRTISQFSAFLPAALTSPFEFEAQLLICGRTKYGYFEKFQKCLSHTTERKKSFLHSEII
jgi:four helix bundle protein